MKALQRKLKNNRTDAGEIDDGVDRQKTQNFFPSDEAKKSRNEIQ
jgi:hypothetical protein